MVPPESDPAAPTSTAISSVTASMSDAHSHSSKAPPGLAATLALDVDDLFDGSQSQSTQPNPTLPILRPTMDLAQPTQPVAPAKPRSLPGSLSGNKRPAPGPSRAPVAPPVKKQATAAPVAPKPAPRAPPVAPKATPAPKAPAPKAPAASTSTIKPAAPAAAAAAAGPDPMSGVVLVISGITNPARGNIRDAAVGLGAEYRPKWTADSTHLICELSGTPKYKEVVGKGHIVKREWVMDSQRMKRRLPEKPYYLDPASDPNRARTAAASSTSTAPAKGGKGKGKGKKKAGDEDESSGPDDYDYDDGFIDDAPVDDIYAGTAGSDSEASDFGDGSYKPPTAMDVDSGDEDLAEVIREGQDYAATARGRRAGGHAAAAAVDDDDEEGHTDEEDAQLQAVLELSKSNTAATIPLDDTQEIDDDLAAALKASMEDAPAATTTTTTTTSTAPPADAPPAALEPTKTVIVDPSTYAKPTLGIKKDGNNGDDDGTPELPSFLTGVTVYFTDINDESREKRLGRYVVAYGGSVDSVISRNTGYIVTGAKAWNDDMEAVMTARPGIKIVRPSWLEACHKKQKAVHWREHSIRRVKPSS